MSSILTVLPWIAVTTLPACAVPTQGGSREPRVETYFQAEDAPTIPAPRSDGSSERAGSAVDASRDDRADALAITIDAWTARPRPRQARAVLISLADALDPWSRAKTAGQVASSTAAIRARARALGGLPPNPLRDRHDIRDALTIAADVLTSYARAHPTDSRVAKSVEEFHQLVLGLSLDGPEADASVTRAVDGARTALRTLHAAAVPRRRGPPPD